jgi:hypothetical protein
MYKRTVVYNLSSNIFAIISRQLQNSTQIEEKYQIENGRGVDHYGLENIGCRKIRLKHGFAHDVPSNTVKQRFMREPD